MRIQIYKKYLKDKENLEKSVARVISDRRNTKVVAQLTLVINTYNTRKKELTDRLSEIFVMDKILIDIDVILDLFFDREPFSEDASKILNLCEKGKLSGFVTPVLISNVYYLLRKTAKHEKVIESLKKLLTIINILLL